MSLALSRPSASPRGPHVGLTTAMARVAAVPSATVETADVGVTKTGPDTVGANSNVAYNVIVFNGRSDAPLT